MEEIFNIVIKKMKLIFEMEKNDAYSYLDVKVIRTENLFFRNYNLQKAQQQQTNN